MADQQSPPEVNLGVVWWIQVVTFLVIAGGMLALVSATGMPPVTQADWSLPALAIGIVLAAAAFVLIRTVRERQESSPRSLTFMIGICDLPGYVGVIYYFMTHDLVVTSVLYVITVLLLLYARPSPQ